MLVDWSNLIPLHGYLWLRVCDGPMNWANNVIIKGYAPTISQKKKDFSAQAPRDAQRQRRNVMRVYGGNFWNFLTRYLSLFFSLSPFQHLNKENNHLPFPLHSRNQELYTSMSVTRVVESRVIDVIPRVRLVCKRDSPW